jgi:hypothetical protein
MFGAFTLISEQAGILLLFGSALVLFALKNNRFAFVGLGFILLLTKPQATIIGAALLGLWMLIKKPRSVMWVLVWLIVLTSAATIAMPNWWSFETEGFGQGLVYQLQGPGQIEFKRVYGTIYDLLAHGFSITGAVTYIAVGALFILGTALSVASWTRYRKPEVILGVGILFTLMVTPYALQYDYTPLIILMFWVILKSSLSPIWVRAVLFLMLAFTFSVLIWQEWSYQGYWQIIGMLAAVSFIMVIDYYREKREINLATGQATSSPP